VIRDGFATRAHVLDGQEDCVPSVRQRLFDRLALAVAAREQVAWLPKLGAGLAVYFTTRSQLF
jgi:hypothetical protein